MSKCVPLLRRPLPSKTTDTSAGELIASSAAIAPSEPLLRRTEKAETGRSANDTFRRAAGSVQSAIAYPPPPPSARAPVAPVVQLNAQAIDEVGGFIYYHGDVSVRVKPLVKSAKPLGPDRFPQSQLRTRLAQPIGRLPALDVQGTEDHVVFPAVENDGGVPELTVCLQQGNKPADFDSSLVETRFAAPLPSTRNYHRMPGWSGKAGQGHRQTELHSFTIEAQDAATEPRRPPYQVLLESKAEMIDSLSREQPELFGTGLELNREQDDGEEEDLPGRYNHTIIAPATAVFPHSSTRYFCGESRSKSPFADPDNGPTSTITLAQAAVLTSMRQGGQRLSFKAHFLSELPASLSCLSGLVFLNLSFNSLEVFPDVLLQLKRLQTLSLRNNPLAALPEEISQLVSLRVLCASFCLLASLPDSLCELTHLRELDVSNNAICMLPSNLEMLRSLRVLNISGNQLTCLPSSAQELHLKQLLCNGNFFHPLFWTESEHNQPQSLRELSQLAVRMGNISLPVDESSLQCQFCNQMLLGKGLRLIAAVQKRQFAVLFLPFSFCVCSTSCYQLLRQQLNNQCA